MKLLTRQQAIFIPCSMSPVVLNVKVQNMLCQTQNFWLCWVVRKFNTIKNFYK